MVGLCVDKTGNDDNYITPHSGLALNDNERENLLNGWR